ncbi:MULTISPECIES: DUF5133 domain-containing protein [unclassified Streptomyces]|uniref:DUF5133 domain-containing protein n=1 Tax=unclassified Streptomyces TaxID=2593676 RepID=UPI0022718509|nr:MULTISPECIES: DUF5133 domain-containing protein [unclassified Streptomyces]MCY0919711.1 DUF5133 domain-containing protein [Streptomyces sp. H27-G5]MCY0955518.1 DUF5133 domain-containing protein [Streptomyces sp. H27-H5]
MLMAHPALLPAAVREYETLSLLNALEGSPRTRRRMEEVAELLCTATGTGNPDAALIAARYGLPGAGTFDDSVLPS